MMCVSLLVKRKGNRLLTKKLSSNMTKRISSTYVAQDSRGASQMDESACGVFLYNDDKTKVISYTA